MTNCAEYYNPSVESAGCVLGWLSLSAALCCSVQVSGASVAGNVITLFIAGGGAV